MPARPAYDAAKIDLERQKFRAQLSTAVNEDDDPLAVYDQFVEWTLKSYGENDPNSGLLELLEQATREFKEDPLYKTDLRYLKLWSLYAAQVDQPAAIGIYAYLLANGIGTSYSILYEGYASLLEAEGRQQDAENIYRKGIKRQARPLERLKTRYREFQSRLTSPPTIPPPPVSSSSGSNKMKSSTDTLRPSSLKNQVSQGRSVSGPSSDQPTPTLVSLNSTPESRYAPMLAPPAPGKRPEKLRCNLSLLFTDDSVEYSIQEARARSMGLLGKKWGPLPATELSRSYSIPVDFNDDGLKSTRTTAIGGRRKSLMSNTEPTVTINTKEALADVFGMYNSPEKTTRLIGVPGSKHAPLKKIEPKALTSLPLLSRENENANQNSKTSTSAFRPFVDENAQSGRAVPGPGKFTPFIDSNPNRNKTPTIASRHALSLKDPATGLGSKLQNGNNAKLQPVTEPPNLENVFSSKVFTPAQKSLSFAPLRNVFTADHGEPQPKHKSVSRHGRAKSQHDVSSSGTEIAQAGAFTPFIDENAKTPFKVFSRPPQQSENALTPKPPSSAFATFSDLKPTFTPFRDTPTPYTPLVDQEPIPEPNPVQEQPIPPWSEGIVELDDMIGNEADVEQYEEDYEYEDGEVVDEQYETNTIPDQAEDEYEESESYREAPLGGRFGRFNVMTPITERTFEFTSSTRGYTPSEHPRHRSTSGINENVFIPSERNEHGALIVAERLAAELREDVSNDYEKAPLEPFRLATDPLPRKNSPPSVFIEEKMGMLSLGDTLTLSSQFKPSNPCNPFDLSIMAALLSRIPTDPHYYDLQDRESSMLDSLQRFAKKSPKAGDLLSRFSVELNGHKFSVSEKLGEGGFGAVFKARDLGTRREPREDEDDSDEDLDDDEEGSSVVALKVVRPRNLWEYHVLRRLHSVLPVSLRRSVILPHALYAFLDESFLVLDYCPQGTLLNIVNGAVAAGVSQQGGCLDELLVAFFTIELLRLLEACHNAGFIHGDLKIDNCLLRLEDVPGGGSAWSSIYQPSGEGGWSCKGLKIIDFGRAIDTRLFPSGQQYIADWTTDERDCFEVQEDKPWTYQTDYFGLAGIIYCMLFGKYIQASSITASIINGKNSRYRINTPLKRYWQIDLWNRLFDALLNPSLIKPDGQLPISNELGGLRQEMENWLKGNCNRSSNTLKGLLKKVEVSCLVH